VFAFDAEFSPTLQPAVLTLLETSPNLPVFVCTLALEALRRDKRRMNWHHMQLSDGTPGSALSTAADGRRTLHYYFNCNLPSIAAVVAAAAGSANFFSAPALPRRDCKLSATARLQRGLPISSR
jgi:hypothetical protein